MKLTEEEKKLLRGAIYAIHLAMDWSEETSYFDDCHADRFPDPKEPFNYDDTDWELCENGEERNGEKIISILRRMEVEL